MLMGFIHRQHINGARECPDRGRLSGHGPDETPFGDEERISVTETYVLAARISVTGVTSCTEKVGLLITRLMGCWDSAIEHQCNRGPPIRTGRIMAKRKKQSKVKKRTAATARGKARKPSKAAKATKRTVAKAKPKPAPVKKAAPKVKQPVAPVVETVAAEVIEQPAPVTVSEVEEIRKAS